MLPQRRRVSRANLAKPGFSTVVKWLSRGQPSCNFIFVLTWSTLNPELPEDYIQVDQNTILKLQSKACLAQWAAPTVSVHFRNHNDFRPMHRHRSADGYRRDISYKPLVNCH